MERAVPTSRGRTPERALRRRFDDRRNNHDRSERKEDKSSRNLRRRDVQIAQMAFQRRNPSSKVTNVIRRKTQ